MKIWNVSSPDKKVVSKLTQSCGITSLTASVLAVKGYSSPESVIKSLNTNQLSDPFLIKDMQTAVDVINNAIDNGEPICIYGDYDCDGIMATAILYSYLFESGADVIWYIPERSEGYGLNKNAVDRIYDDGIKLIITVDNGISAIPEAEYIYSLGMKLIVTDHHQQGEELPKAEAIVDPHRHDCLSPFKYACGAVIALKLVAALNGGDYTSALEQFGDLAAIATVADIVSLTSENRFIAAYGLNLINNTDRPALIALKEVAGLNDKKVDSKSIGFSLAPRINASGRFGSPKTAMELFLCEDYEKALVIAQELDSLNSRRKNTENDIISEIYQMIDKNPSLINERVIFLCGKNWHHGVIGIVASRIMDKFCKPVFIASEENGEIRGSARSFGKFSIFEALTYTSETLVKFGGHPAAGGFTIKNGMTENFRKLLNEYALKNHKIMPIAEIKADMHICASDLTVENIQGLDLLEPFGTENEKPLFLLENVNIINIIPISNGMHSKFKIKIDYLRTEAIMFRKSPHELNVKDGDVCDMVVSLSVNHFMDKVSVSIFINDIRPHGFMQTKYFAALNAFETFMRGEKLPDNYYASMLPSRDSAAKIYKNIPENGINSDTLYLRLNDSEINYCRFRLAVEAMKQLGLIEISSENSEIRRIKDATKTDLNSAPILAGLREKIAGIDK